MRSIYCRKQIFAYNPNKKNVTVALLDTGKSLKVQNIKYWYLLTIYDIICYETKKQI